MTFKLASGFKIPQIGLGSYPSGLLQDFETLKKMIIDHGYRHIDTASHYNNEEQIGEVLQFVFANTKIKRDDIFITTKLWCSDKKDIPGALKKSLTRLKLDYADLYLIHWPIAFQGNDLFSDLEFERIPMHIQWKQMEECVKLNLTRSIGLCNVNFQLLNDVLTYAEIRPACNQIEIFPYLTQYHFVEWMKKENILPIAYSPLGRPYFEQNKENIALLDPVIKKIAENHKATASQILLAWGIARGQAVIPKTSNADRGLENIGALNIKLSQNEVDEITNLNKNYRTVSTRQINGLFKGIPLFD